MKQYYDVSLTTNWAESSSSATERVEEASTTSADRATLRMTTDGVKDQ